MNVARSVGIARGLLAGSDFASPMRKAPVGTQESVWHGSCRISALLRV